MLQTFLRTFCWPAQSCTVWRERRPESGRSRIFARSPQSLSAPRPPHPAPSSALSHMLARSPAMKLALEYSRHIAAPFCCHRHLGCPLHAAHWLLKAQLPACVLQLLSTGAIGNENNSRSDACMQIGSIGEEWGRSALHGPRALHWQPSVSPPLHMVTAPPERP